MISGQRRVGTALLVAAIVMTACTSGDDVPGVAQNGETSSAPTDSDRPTSETSDSVVESSSIGDDESAKSESATPNDLDDPPLGFDTARFEPSATRTAEGIAGFDGASELIDQGMEEGIWTEIEAVRAIVSVLMGEEPPSLVPGLDDLPHPSIPVVLDRARALLADDTVGAAERADLGRLTLFFFDTPPADADAPTGGAEPQGLRSLQQAAGDCAAEIASEAFFKAAEARGVRYCRVESGEDTVLYPIQDPNADDVNLLALEDAADRMLLMIERARVGYLDLAGTEMPPVKFLISPREDPDPKVRAFGHVVSATSTICNGAIFAPERFLQDVEEMENTMAHELFHCVQGEWAGEELTDFVAEAGANYFAYRLLGRCGANDAGLIGALDAKSTTASLLDLSYEGWFFWAFLEDHLGIAPQETSQMHQTMKSGARVDLTLIDNLPNASKNLNEFFVRMMGPGLACGGTGRQVTTEQVVTATGPVTMQDSPWVGTRHRVVYPPQTRHELTAADSGPIGMASDSQRSSESDWVIVEPDVRASCADPTKWIVVVAGSTDPSQGSVERKFNVDRRETTECDPCPIGEWDIDLNTMAEFFASFGPIEVTLEGFWRLKFDGSSGGGPATFADAHEVVQRFANSFDVNIAGSSEGTWTADGDALSVTELSGSNTASLFGQSATDTSTGSGSLPYVCDGAQMQIMANGVAIVLTRAESDGEPYFG